MKLMLLLLAVSAILELLAAYWLRGGVRKAAAVLVLVATSFASGSVALYRPNVATGLLVCLSLYRIVNLLRVVEARVNEVHLRRTTRVTATWLVGLQVTVLAGWCTVEAYRINSAIRLAGVFGLQLLAALVLLASTLRHLRTTKPLRDNVIIADKELPTVTVAIPARNEDEQLKQCLQTVLASDYPKLEVLVLDDCSQDRTPEILRQFAHDGVRFILGSEPKPNWLAKNQAYERLANEASGELLLFCGVDVRFGASTIHNIVANLVHKKKSMVSVMPQNDLASLSLPQFIRYAWELALPRRMFNRPPVLSSCWLIKAAELKRLGGFAAVSHSITPEAHFARGTIVHDGYSFLRSDDHLGLTSTKTITEQRATATRTRYPQLHRRPELVAILSFHTFRTSQISASLKA